MKIGILTGGGDVPGLNACIKAVTTLSRERDWSVLGFRCGWAGLVNFDLDHPDRSRERHTVELNRERVRTIDRFGGTFLHTSRTDPKHIPKKDLPAHLADAGLPVNGDVVDCTAHVLKVLDYLGIDRLITLGGDGTLSYSAYLHRQGVPIISVPKTMDNDVYGTDYCIGFSTAVTRSIDAITSLRTTTASHERVGVVELFGRLSGETALISGYLAGTDRVTISEVPVNLDRLAALVKQDHEDNPRNYAMVVVSEGTRIEGGPDYTREIRVSSAERQFCGIGHEIGSGLSQRTGLDMVIQSLAYLMRSGPPDALDRMVANAFGTLAVQLLERKQVGRMVSVIDGNYTSVEADTLLNGRRRVDVDALYDRKAYRPKIADIDNKPMFLY